MTQFKLINFVIITIIVKLTISVIYQQAKHVFREIIGCSYVMTTDDFTTAYSYTIPPIH